MKMDKVYVNRRRWVAFILIGIPALILSYYIVNHIWWTGTGYCFGSMIQCVKL